MIDERQVRWHARRGMKELDLVLGRYLDRGWPVADAAERAAFVELLVLQDPELWALIAAHGTAPAGNAGNVVERIRAHSGL